MWKLAGCVPLACLLSLLAATADALTGAHISDNYGMVGHTCAQEIDGVEVTKLVLSPPTINNLGGQGPVPHSDEVIKYEHVATVGGQQVDLVVENVGKFRSRNSSRNGFNGFVGNINSRSSMTVEVNFKFLYSGSGSPAAIPWLEWSLFNLNHNNYGRPRCFRTFGFASYALAENTTVEVTEWAENKYQFCSSMVQNGISIRSHTLTPQQRRVAVAFMWQHVTEINLVLDQDMLNRNGGRNTQFSGSTSWICPFVPNITNHTMLMTSPQGYTSKGFPSELTAGCVFDNLQVATYLSQAGTAIQQAVPDCTHDGWPWHDSTAEHPGAISCWIDVSKILESFGYSASFLAAAVNQCDLDHQNTNAQCASDISGLIAAVADLMEAGGGMSQDCPDGKFTNGPWPWQVTPKPDIQPVPLLPTPPPGPRPVPPHQQTILQRKFGAQVAFCAIDSIQASWYLAQAGLNVDAAVHVCPSKSPKAYCSTSVSAVVQSFSYVAAFIAGAAGQCAHGLNANAMCASDVTRLVAALGAVAARASSMSQYCTGKAKEMAVAQNMPLYKAAALTKVNHLSRRLSTKGLKVRRDHEHEEDAVALNSTILV